MSTTIDLSGLVAVVTGAASGQGAAEAAALSAAGAKVIATDIQDPLEPFDAAITFRRLDVSSADDWDALASWIAEHYGHVDVLVNNAGVPVMGGVADVPLDDWNFAFAVNVTGPLLGIQSLLPLMRSGASIVNIASIAALTGHWPVAYTASKWALRGLSRVASNDLGRRGIRVNTVFPGYIDTPMVAAGGEEFKRLSIEDVPLGRIGMPRDVAPLVVFLASPASSYISGAEIPVDGGETAHGGMKKFLDVLNPQVAP